MRQALGYPEFEAGQKDGANEQPSSSKREEMCAGEHGGGRSWTPAGKTEIAVKLSLVYIWDSTLGMIFAVVNVSMNRK